MLPKVNTNTAQCVLLSRGMNTGSASIWTAMLAVRNIPAIKEDTAHPCLQDYSGNRIKRRHVTQLKFQYSKQLQQPPQTEQRLNHSMTGPVNWVINWAPKHVADWKHYSKSITVGALLTCKRSSWQQSKLVQNESIYQLRTQQSYTGTADRVFNTSTRY